MNMADEAKLCSPNHSILKHWLYDVRWGAVMEKNWALSADQCQLQVLPFSVPLIDWLSILLRCNGFSRIQRRRQWHPTPVLLPGKSHGRRSLVGCSPWVCQESDTTKRLHFHFSLSCIGEGNGSSLQCSCLENPMVRGAWWATVHEVAKSQTQLK